MLTTLVDCLILAVATCAALYFVAHQLHSAAAAAGALISNPASPGR